MFNNIMHDRNDAPEHQLEGVADTTPYKENQTAREATAIADKVWQSISPQVWQVALSHVEL